MYNIAIAFDNQSDYSLVLIKNIIDKSNKDELTFHIFIGDNTRYEWHEDWLRKESVNYQLLRISKSDLRGMKIDKEKYKHITDAAFFRLLMPSILSDVKSFLYLDTDVYINFDIREIFAFYSNNKAITVASTGVGFNSGVMLINTRDFNKTISVNNLALLFSKYNFAGDNELLVAYFKDFGIMGLEYNMSPYDLLQHSDDSVVESCNPKIIHFKGTAKPWRYSTVLPFAGE
jgi:lipopolysaccharide biosynthesis glycosyltransferase